MGMKYVLPEGFECLVCVLQTRIRHSAPAAQKQHMGMLIVTHRATQPRPIRLELATFYWAA